MITMHRIVIQKQHLLSLGGGVLASLIAWALTQTLALTIAVIFAFIIGFWVFDHYYSAFIVSRHCGIKDVYPEQAVAVDTIRAQILKAKNIDILTIRGLGIFGLKESLLRKSLLARPGQVKIRILFLAPDSTHVASRAKETSANPSAFKHSLHLTQQYIHELVDSKVDVQAYTYDATPIWRLIFFDDNVFVSSYVHARDGHKSPMYHISRSGDWSLFDTFKKEFEAKLKSSSPLI